MFENGGVGWGFGGDEGGGFGVGVLGGRSDAERFKREIEERLAGERKVGEAGRKGESEGTERWGGRRERGTNAFPSGDARRRLVR